MKKKCETVDVRKGEQDGSIVGQCALCDVDNAALKESHSIPKFAFQWLKDTSKTPYIRSSDDVNIRHQDGPKEYLLGGNCEGYLAVFEKDLSENFFKKIANYRQQKRVVYISEAMRLAVLSIFWRSLLTTKDRENGRTSEDNLAFDAFLESMKFDIQTGSSNVKIYFAPFYGDSPYFKLPKSMTYPLERQIGSQDMRFFDDPHRFFAALKLPFMYFYIFSDGWSEDEIKESVEFSVGEIDLSKIKDIPNILRNYINRVHHQYLENLTKIDTKNLKQIVSDVSKNPNITGSDKSRLRSE